MLLVGVASFYRLRQIKIVQRRAYQLQNQTTSYSGCVCQEAKQGSSIYYIRVKYIVSTCLTNESELQEAEESRLLKFSALAIYHAETTAQGDHNLG